MIDEGKVTQADLKSRKLNFTLNNVFLTGTLQELLEKLNVNNEESLELYYSFALNRPKPTHSIP